MFATTTNKKGSYIIISIPSNAICFGVFFFDQKMIDGVNDGKVKV